LPNDKVVIESWPLESKKKLFNLITASKRDGKIYILGVFFLSGDIHCSEMMKDRYL
jgi:hypothetical protein